MGPGWRFQSLGWWILSPLPARYAENVARLRGASKPQTPNPEPFLFPPWSPWSAVAPCDSSPLRPPCEHLGTLHAGYGRQS
jgi:hypothetical protein